MAATDWLRPPRYLVILFFGISFVLIGTLGWLGWRLFQQDRALERQRVQDRLEHAANVVAAEWLRDLTTLEDALADFLSIPESDLPRAATAFSERFTGDALVLVLQSERMDAYPADRLTYYPVVSSPREPGQDVFAQGESYEFRDRNLGSAARVYRRLAQSGDSALRAGALLRLARTERKAGDSAAALEAYVDLAALGGTTVGGLPAELVARAARLDLLNGSSRDVELRSEAQSLLSDLNSGRWRLTRSQHEFYTAELCQRIVCDSSQVGVATASAQSARALAAGAERLWDRRTTAEGRAPRNRRRDSLV